ncbi:MAG: sigma-70 family RNA polymerase sigma factor [Ignavibacterium sp.]|jgi:RNA polymerase sigma-70 factor (ECF subfamily)|nr:sigma-70 family RNA polymerase sigma factor [Ignavibacterium sp.]
MNFTFDEKSLIEKIVSGDTDAENRLFLHFKERIEFLVRARLRNKISSDDQKDILSEAKQAILLSLRKGGFDPAKGKPLEAYIAGIVSNVVAMYFRNLTKTNPTEDIDKLHKLESFTNPLMEILDYEKKEIIRSALASLEDKYKEVILLRIYEEQSIEEISGKIGIEKRRVSERINYALKLLLKELKKKNYFQYPDILGK